MRARVRLCVCVYCVVFCCVLLCCVVWCGVVWWAVVWCGVVWCGVVWGCVVWSVVLCCVWPVQCVYLCFCVLLVEAALFRRAISETTYLKKHTHTHTLRLWAPSKIIQTKKHSGFGPPRIQKAVRFWAPVLPQRPRARKNTPRCPTWSAQRDSGPSAAQAILRAGASGTTPGRSPTSCVEFLRVPGVSMTL